MIFIAFKFQNFIKIPDHVLVLDLSTLEFDRHQKMQEYTGFLILVRLRLKAVIAFGAGKTWLIAL